MSGPAPKSQADIFVFLLKNLWLLGFWLLIVFVFGVAFWAIFGWKGLLGVAVIGVILWNLAGNAARRRGHG